MIDYRPTTGWLLSPLATPRHPPFGQFVSVFLARQIDAEWTKKHKKEKIIPQEVREAYIDYTWELFVEELLFFVLFTGIFLRNSS